MKVRVRRINPAEREIPITTEYIKLESFLKLANAVESGGMAKNFILNEEVSVNGEIYGTVNLITREEVDLARSEYMKRQLKEFFSNSWVIGVTMVLLTIAALYVALQIRYRKAREKYMEERRQAEIRRRKRQKEFEEKRRSGWEL